MQVVFEISKESYDSIMAKDPREIMGTLAGLVQRGTVLPEKHGRLIDADELKYKKIGLSNKSLMMFQVAEIIDNVPTILEAREKR